jgi:hypothetical protein
MPIQVSHGVISRADAIRENAIILLERELSETFDTPTPAETPASSGRVSNPPQVNSGTSFVDHIFTFVIFIALASALFAVVVSR